VGFGEAASITLKYYIRVYLFFDYSFLDQKFVCLYIDVYMSWNTLYLPLFNSFMMDTKKTLT